MSLMILLCIHFLWAQIKDPSFYLHFSPRSPLQDGGGCLTYTKLSYLTGGHFACACVNPLNDNSVGASNLMAGNRKLALKVTTLLKAISLVFWIPYFPTKKYPPLQKSDVFYEGFHL